ncbi:MAG TPA: MBL fold metallo-hydrolase [Candidatus Limnocylindria bacterium]|nr:MBL fold metallo-hydrolase [Candidatus Limnocylindria bacterium]
MEIISFGDTCLRLRGREGVVAADAFTSIVGPTGRGLTADIATYSRADDGRPTLGLDKGSKKGARRRIDGSPVPTSLESAFLLESPGEYEVHEVLMTGVRTFRDESRGSERGFNTCFVYELDGLHLIHLGDIGHLLNEDMLEEVGTVDVACVPVGGSLPVARAAELVAQLDAKLIVPMPFSGNGAGEGDLRRFLHEMSVQDTEPVPKLSVTISSLPQEATVALLEPRARS